MIIMLVTRILPIGILEASIGVRSLLGLWLFGHCYVRCPGTGTIKDSGH